MELLIKNTWVLGVAGLRVLGSAEGFRVKSLGF